MNVYLRSGKILKEPDLNYRKSVVQHLIWLMFLMVVMMVIFKNLNLWDIVAGVIIINEAGGIIDNIDLSNNKNIKVIASSPNINVN